MKKQWRAAAYLRLSRDDENYCSESVSIKNQKALISNYLEDHPEIRLVDVYADDGYSGVNFDRPAFSDMMCDINVGMIDCVIVKDLSRLGRNTTKVGSLKDEIFPSKGIRFIAINDNVDTKGGIDDNDVTDFKLLFNEYYVKDISKKIRSSLRASAKQGLFVGSYAPYGYKKSAQDKHKLIIDDEASKIVKRIFVEFSEGKSGREIAENLNSENILSPLTYRNKNLGKESKPYFWTSHTILEILKNEVYFGNMVQHKRENVSYKLKQRRFVEEEEQIVVCGTHKAIIDEDLRMAVSKVFEQEINRRNRKTLSGKRLPILFSGLLVCSDCGGKLAATTKHGKRCYRCSKYNNAGSVACSSHYITEEELLHLVRYKMNELIFECEIDRERFFYKIMKNMLQEKLKEANEAKVEKVKCKSRVKEIEKTMAQLYEDKIQKAISQQMFLLLSEKYSNELENLLQLISSYDKIINKTEINEAFVKSWIDALLNMKNCKSPSYKDLNALIDKVYVRAVGVEQRIKIKFKVGFIENSCEALVNRTA